MKRAIGVALLLVSAAGTAGAADLLSVYQDALANDPSIRQADALRKASREARPQAWSALLPQISGSASVTRGKTDQFSLRQQIDQATNETFLFPQTFNQKPDTRTWAVNLRQNLFSWSKWATFRASDSQVAQAEADYRTAEQDLIQRVSQRYFNVLSALDTLDAQQAAQAAFSSQLDQANKRFEVGLIAITDVQDTKAARDQANASVIAAKRSLASAVEQLREVTGQKYDDLAKPGGEMALKSPEPNLEQQWVDISLDQNPSLLSSRLAADTAREQVRVAFGGHVPEIDLVATRDHSEGKGDASFADSGPYTSYPTEGNDKTYGVQVTVPIFSGGLTQSRVRESQYRWIAAKERVTATSRATERAARDAYLGVISNIAKVEALRQAMESSQTALKATEAGYEVGTRTSVDVLDTRRRLVQDQTNYYTSRYEYLLTVVSLRQAAGNLDKETLSELNQLLNITVKTAPTDPASLQTPAPAPRN